MKALFGATTLAIGLAGCGSSSATPLDGSGGARGTALEAGAGSGGGTGSGGVATSGGGAMSSDAGPRADSGALADAGPARHFRLATTGAQLVVSGPDLGLQLTPANLTDDADVFAIHQEFYGVPWDEFEQGKPPPAEWVAAMDRLASSAKQAARPVFLSISMLDGQRQHLAAKTTIQNGAVKTTESWSATCYDFTTATDGASKKSAYLAYVAYMVQKFAPTYLNLAIEVNLFFEKCPSAAAGVVDVANAAYDAVKATAPSTIVFPSIQIDHLYGYSKDSCPDPAQRDSCFAAAYGAIAPLHRDRFAMSTYPYMNEIGAPESLPPDWFTRGASQGGEKPLVAETGWPSTDLVVRAMDGTCPTIFSFDEPESARYLARVLADADTKGMDLVTWWSDRDLVVSELMTDCPCTFDATWCSVLDVFRGPPSTNGTDTQMYGELLLKAFGTMGIRAYDGRPKPQHYAEWSEARRRTFEPL